MDTHIILKPVRDSVPEQMLQDIEACIFGIREDEIYFFAENEENVKVFCEDINPE